MSKISSQRFKKNIDNSLIDNTTFDEFHPIFKKHYIPHRTSADGNCLFNTISLCLCGNESLTIIFRACTVYTIIKFRNQFTEVIKREEQIHNVDNNVNTLNDIIIKKFNKILYEAKTNYFWCNLYHLLTISTFLNTDIYIYSSFYNRIAGSLYHNAQSTDELIIIFNNKQRTGSHLIYTPITNCNITTRKENPIYGYFSSMRKHYTSIIPVSAQSPLFKPTTLDIHANYKL